MQENSDFQLSNDPKVPEVMINSHPPGKFLRAFNDCDTSKQYNWNSTLFI
jgi:hypothetical protein